MTKRQHHINILKELLVSTVGLALVILAYSGWQIYQDFQILKNIKNQQEQLSRYRQQAEQKPQEPQAWLQLGDAAFDFWQNAGQGIRIAGEVNQMDLAWELLGAKNSALKEASMAYGRVLKLAPD